MKKLLLSSAFILMGFMSQQAYSYNDCHPGTAVDVCEKDCGGVMTTVLKCPEGQTACSCPGAPPSTDMCVKGTDSIRTCQKDPCNGVVTTDLKCPEGETACSCKTSLLH